jgi:hypothetical protein
LGPFTALSVDELLFLFKGRYWHRQHIRGKPHATGLKWYSFCDKSGVFYSFWLYQGEKSQQLILSQSLLNNCQSTFLILFMLTYSLGVWNLQKNWKKQGLFFVLCCKKSRPSFLFKNRLDIGLEKGRFAFAIHNQDKLFALSFHDKKKCHFLKNIHSNSTEIILSKKGKQSKEVLIAVKDYVLKAIINSK